MDINTAALKMKLMDAIIEQVESLRTLASDYPTCNGDYDEVVDNINFRANELLMDFKFDAPGDLPVTPKGALESAATEYVRTVRYQTGYPLPADPPWPVKTFSTLAQNAARLKDIREHIAHSQAFALSALQKRP